MNQYSASKYLRALERSLAGPHKDPKLDVEAFIIVDEATGRNATLEIDDICITLVVNGVEGRLTATEEGRFLPRDRYEVITYSFHYQHPSGSFRFDSHDGHELRPHFNDPQGVNTDDRHLYYHRGFGLDAEDMNLWLALNLCQYYSRSGHFPRDRAFWDEYNTLLRRWRDRIR